MTKREMFEKIATVNAENTEIVEFCNHEIELLDNRNSNKKPSKKDKENDVIMNTIYDIMTVADGRMTVKELLATEELGQYTSQKISALLRKMCLDGKLVKTYEKKVAYFSLAE